MNRILPRALVFTFFVVLSGTYVSKILWACDAGGYSSYESREYMIQTKAEVKSEKPEAVKDPVCGMEVSDIKKASSEEYKGKVYYFCSEHCKKAFKKDPASYIRQHGEGEGHKH